MKSSKEIRIRNGKRRIRRMKERSLEGCISLFWGGGGEWRVFFFFFFLEIGGKTENWSVGWVCGDME